MALNYRRSVLSVLLLGATVACYRSYSYTVLTWNPLVSDGPGPQFQAFLQAQVDSILAANPDSDAIDRVRQGDLSLLALQGYAPYVPGFDGPLDQYRRRYGFHFILPQCEVRSSELHTRFCAVAYDYAERYNRMVLSHVREPPR